LQDTLFTEHDTKELQEASDAFEYEASMVLDTFDLLWQQTPGTPIAKAILESFLIHARLLIDFFYHGKKYRRKIYRDDIVPEQFRLDPDELNKIRPPDMSTVLNQARDKADKLLAHLTYTRIRETEDYGRWDVGPIKSEIQNILKIFVQRVPSELQGQKFKALAERLG
jgi:hypothetical protein